METSTLTTMRTLRRSLTASSLKTLPQAQRQKYLNSLSEQTKAELLYNWLFWARDSQLIPDALLLDPEINTWNIIAGRGNGKTRTGAESVRWLVENAGYRNVMLVGRTEDEVKDIMVKGSSGLLSIYPPWNKPIYEPTNRVVYFPNGATAITRSADKPDQIRGQNTDLVWGDEIASWRYPESYDQIQFGNRVGKKPLQIYTTTPRPTALIKELVESPHAITTGGSTYDNLANLAKTFVDFILKKYERTTLGRQELLAEILEGIDGALWTLALLEPCHIFNRDLLPRWQRKVIAVDPAAKSNPDSAETGIIACALGTDDLGYVLEDGSIRGTPLEWATQTIKLFDRWQADLILVEDNQGGEMVESNLRTIRQTLPIKRVTSIEDKYTRAQPVASLYEQNRVRHFGVLSELEDQMTTWRKGERSPDRIDAMVHGIRELMVTGGKSWGNAATGKQEKRDKREIRKRLARGR